MRERQCHRASRSKAIRRSKAGRRVPSPPAPALSLLAVACPKGLVPIPRNTSEKASEQSPNPNWEFTHIGEGPGGVEGGVRRRAHGPPHPSHSTPHHCSREQLQVQMVPLKSKGVRLRGWVQRVGEHQNDWRLLGQEGQGRVRGLCNHACRGGSRVAVCGGGLGGACVRASERGGSRARGVASERRDCPLPPPALGGCCSATTAAASPHRSTGTSR